MKFFLCSNDSERRIVRSFTNLFKKKNMNSHLIFRGWGRSWQFVIMPCIFSVPSLQMHSIHGCYRRHHGHSRRHHIHIATEQNGFHFMFIPFRLRFKWFFALKHFATENILHATK